MCLRDDQWINRGSFILVIEHKYAGVGEELAAFMQDDGCVFGTSIREWVFAGRRKSLSETCLPPLYQASEKEMGGSGCGGLSVLEESHVVSESGQLLLIWNQWDGGRICWGRERARGERNRGEVESDGDSSCCQALSIFLHLPGFSSAATAHVPQLRETQQVAGFKWPHRLPPPPICLTTLPTESPPWNMWDIQPGDHYNTLHLNPTRMISCVRSTPWPKLPGTVKVWKGGGEADTWGWLVSGLACCAGHVCSRCFSSIVRWLQSGGRAAASSYSTLICRFL